MAKAEVELFADLSEVEADAGGALDRAAQPCIFHRLSWFRLIAAHCPPAGEPLVLRARDGNRRAWLFVAAEGQKAHALANWYSLRFDAIGDPDLMAPLAAALLERGFAAATFAPMADSEPLRRAFRKAGWLTFVRRATTNWHADTSGLSFADYLAKRPGRLRNTLKRKERSAALAIRIHRRFDPQAWADYESVYRASWKPEEGSFPFLRALSEMEGPAGTLRLGIAYKGERPVAAQLWLVENGTATIHKLAYDEAAKALSPGSLLSAAMFRHAIDEDRVGRIDYGTGDEPYKADWMDAKRPLWQLSTFNPRRPSGLFGGIRAGASLLVGQGRSR